MAMLGAIRIWCVVGIFLSCYFCLSLVLSFLGGVIFMLEKVDPLL